MIAQYILQPCSFIVCIHPPEIFERFKTEYAVSFEVF